MSDRPTVLITNAVPEEHLAPLLGAARILQGPSGGRLMPRDEVLRLTPELSGIINQAELRVDAELLDAGPHLKIIANVAKGVDNLDLALMAKRGVWATNAPDAFAESTAECTWALLLALTRRLRPADRYVRSGQWLADGFQPAVWDGTLLAGKTWGVIGYGAIGRAVARRAQAFDMTVIYHAPSRRGQSGFCEIDQLLAQSDVVSLHVPLTPQTRHLIDARRLALMRPTAYLINMARGPVVDEAALVEALGQYRLAGAGLDVFENEPRVHPDLLAMEHVMLTPHIGGGTHESRRAARQLCAQNIAAVLDGREPSTPVNRPIGCESQETLP